MTSSAVQTAVIAHIASALSAYSYVENKDYRASAKPPSNVDEFISARFPGSTRIRGEVGGDPADEINAYFEDGAFRIDVFVRGNPQFSTTAPNQDREIAIREAVVRAFMGKSIANVEIFSVTTGLEVPAGAPSGWWAESISCGFHYEHFGP